MIKCEYVPINWRRLVDERVRLGDFYWNHNRWLPVCDAMLDYKIEYDVVRRTKC